MPQVEHSVTINRPVSEVFRFVNDADNMAEWQPDVRESHLTGEKMRVGVMMTQTRTTHLLGWRLDLNADIVGYQPNKSIEYQGILGRFPVRGQIAFESMGGNTTVTESLEIRMGFLFAIFSPMMSGTMKRRTRNALETLKEKLENRSVTGNSKPTDFHNQL